MNNDKQNKSQPDDRSTLDDLAQRTRIEREVNNSKRYIPKRDEREAEPDDDQEDWSWGDVIK